MRAQKVMSKSPEGHDQGTETLRTRLRIQERLKNKFEAWRETKPNMVDSTKYQRHLAHGSTTASKGHLPVTFLNTSESLNTSICKQGRERTTFKVSL